MIPNNNKRGGSSLLLQLLLLLTSTSFPFSLDQRVGVGVVHAHAHDITTTMNNNRTTIQASSYADGGIGGLEEIHHDCFVPIQLQQHDDNDIDDPQKVVYTIGVLAHRGIKAAYKEFNATFNAYLTATAGKRFQTNIQFQMIALNYTEIFTFSEQKLIDFIYVNPSGKYSTHWVKQQAAAAASANVSN